MAKTKTKTKSGSGKDILRGASGHLQSSSKPKSSRSIEELLTEATTFLEQSQPERALPLVEEALLRLEKDYTDNQDIDTLLESAAEGNATLPDALVLGAEVNLALGDVEIARAQFQRATSIDPDGALISAEPYLWLSQLSEEGGKESKGYFEKAVEVLRNEIDVLEDSGMEDEHTQQALDEKRSKLAETLCGMAEIYMTDLSWEDDAEAQCERLVTEGVAVCPERLSAGVLQTLANVRISQERIDEARKALAASMTIWKDLPPEDEDPAKPDFATRVSLTRLLMEVEAEEEALFVLEGLLKEDDQSVECTYLRGWCNVLLSRKPNMSEDRKVQYVEQARILLGTCLKLYATQEYEDTKLREHALELVGDLNKILGIEDDDEWEDEDDDGDDDSGDEDLILDDNKDGIHDGDVEMT